MISLGRHFFIPWKLNLVCLTNLMFSKIWQKTETKKKIEVVGCDGSEEYNSKNFITFYKENGIIKETTIPCILE